MSDTPSPAPAPLPGVRPLTGFDLRLISAWASGMLDEEVVFACDGAADAAESRLTRASPAALEAPDRVVIPARSRSRGQALAALHVSVDGVEGEVPAREWNAAFWSESAVEKFLVPYLAALAGSGAAEVLGPLVRAWNGYPEDRPAFALLHRARLREGAALSLAGLVDVLYLDRSRSPAALGVEPLGEFLERCEAPARTPAPVAALRYRRGSVAADAPALPSEYLLRRMAEWADALRETPRYFLFDTVSGRFSAPVERLPDDLAGQVVIPAFTPPARADRPFPAQVALRPAEGEATLLPRESNAAFWGTGSVDNILIPYYAAAYGAAWLREMADIRDLWTDGVPPAGPRDAEMEAETGAEVVYAMIHYPKSDWATETETTPTPLDTLAGLWGRPDRPGTPRVAPLRGAGQRRR